MTEWQDGDELNITFGTLKQAMSEATVAERDRIVSLLLAECDCEEMYRCTYHRMVDVIRVGTS
jgi:hypothetical protein